MRTATHKATITIEGDPGDRIGGIDADGYCYQSVAVRVSADDPIRVDLSTVRDDLSRLRGVDQCDRDEVWYGEILAADERRDLLLHDLLSRPVWRSERVWVGHNQ